MSRFDDRPESSNIPAQPAWARPGGEHDDSRYPGDEFGGTYGRRASSHPGHRDFGGNHAYDPNGGRHPGHRNFGRHEAPGLYGGDGRDWTASGYPGGHRGAGPKGYERSDARIREDVCDRLTEHDAIDAGSIDVQVTGGVVTLTGEVPKRYMKHLAEDTVAEASGVRDVENTLRVTGPARRDEPTL